MDNKNILEWYLEELKSVKALDKEEESILIQRLLQKDNAARNRLIEANLMEAMSISRDYIGRGVSLDDLIGEINLALSQALFEYREGELKNYLHTYIRKHLEEFIEIEGNQKKAEDIIKDKLNDLKEAAEILALELGREPKAEEIAHRLGLDLDSVNDLIKMSMDALVE